MSAFHHLSDFFYCPLSGAFSLLFWHFNEKKLHFLPVKKVTLFLFGSLFFNERYIQHEIFIYQIIYSLGCK